MMNYLEQNNFFLWTGMKNVRKNKKIFAIAWIHKLKILMFFDKEQFKLERKKALDFMKEN